MGSIVYNPHVASVSSSARSVLLDATVNNSAQTILNKMIENGKVKDLTQSKFDLGEMISNAILEGFKRTLKWFGGVCLEGLKILWKFTVDISFYGCLFTATGSILMAYCGSKKSKKAIATSIIVYILIQMINGILIEQGYITP